MLVWLLEPTGKNMALAAEKYPDIFHVFPLYAIAGQHSTYVHKVLLRLGEKEALTDSTRRCYIFRSSQLLDSAIRGISRLDNYVGAKGAEYLKPNFETALQNTRSLWRTLQSPAPMRGRAATGSGWTR